MVLAAGGGFVLKLFEMQTPLTAGIYRLCHRLFAATTLCKPVAAPPWRFGPRETVSGPKI